MDPQNNPLNNAHGDDVPAGDITLPAGGSTFQPQDNPAGATPPPTPGWQNEDAADAAGVYGAAQTEQGAAAMPPNPLLADSQPAPAPNPTEAMSQDFQHASQMTAPTVAPGASDQPAAMPESTMPNSPLANAAPASPPEMPPNPLMADSQPAATAEPATPVPAAMPEAPQAAVNEINPASDMGGSPPPDAPGVNPQPAQAEVPMPPQEPAGAPAPILAPQPGNLPGSQQLGAAAAGMDQGQAGASAQMPGSMGTYGPPPKKSKKALFIILGAVIGIIVISAIIAVLLSTRKQPAQNINTTTETTQQTVATPTSGPATPPAGYKTIEKQCYTFALITPNTVPTDQACSFKKSTFGQKAVSTIAVDTSTTAYKTIDEFLDVFKQDKTVESEENIKLDNLDAKQIIYKYSDGKTYSYTAALITGKSYQQDGKAVTAIGINNSYQDTFDQGVTQNIIDTWRWK